MKQLAIASTAATAAVVLLAMASCGGSGGPGRRAWPNGPASYLAVSNSNVAFIQWRATSSGHLRGTITDGNAGGSAPAETVSVSSAPFTGTMSGGSVRLAFAVLFFLHASANGTLSGGRLTLGVPQPDGAIRQVTFSQSGVTSYHSAIARLRRTIQHANRQAARQQARQSREPLNAQAEQGADSSLSAVYNQSSLASGGILAGVIARFAAHVQAARSGLATEKRDASADNRYCAAAFRVSGDAQSVDGDLEAAEGGVLSMMADISTVRADIMTAKAHLRDLSKARLPAPGSASTVIGSAEANLGQAIATGNSYVDQVNAIDAQARSLAIKMASGSCSGARPGSQARPIAHIK